LVLLTAAAWLGGAAARAQSSADPAAPIQIDARGVPLAEALAEVRAQTGVDLVFAHALVEGKRASCRFAGTEAERALACLLGGTGLRAERVQRRQFVIMRGAPEGRVAGRESLRRTLAGFVTDAKTGDALPGAHVSLPELDLGAATNDAGFFSVAQLPRRRYRVRVSYVGYRTLDTTVVAARKAPRPAPRDSASGVAAGSPEERFVELALRPQALESEQVVVDPSAEGPRLVPGSPSARPLSAKALEAMPSFLGEGDLIQALERRPGVRKRGTVGGGMRVRGGQTDQNLYLLDGAPVYRPWHAFGLLSTFQTGTLQRARLYEGRFPAQHGGRLAAVLDAELKDGRRPSGQPQATLGLSPLSARFQVEAPLSDRFSLMLSGRRSYLDLLIGERHPVAGGGRRDTLRTGYTFHDLSAKLSARLSQKHRLSLSYYRGRDDLDLRLPFDLSLDFSSWLRPADFFFEIGQRWENRLLSARHRWLASERLFLTSTAYVSRYAAREGTFVRPSAGASVKSDYRVALRDLGLKVDASYALGPTHQLRAGLKGARRHFGSRLTTDLQRAPGVGSVNRQRSQQRATEAAAYVQDTWQPTPRLVVRPGLRASAFSGGDGHLRLSPRLSVSYRAHPRWLTLRASGGRFTQYLHRLRDRYSLVYDLAVGRWVPVTGRTEPARAGQLSAGASGRPLPALTVQADAYWRRATDVLVPRDPEQRKDQLRGLGLGAGALLGQYTAATTRAYGLELEARYDPAGPWRARLGYAAARSRVDPATPPTGDRAGPPGADSYPDRYNLPHRVQAGVRYTGARWNAGLSAVARSGSPITVPVARYRLSGALPPGKKEKPTAYLHRPQRGNGRLPAYLRLDATVGRRFAWLGADWHAQLHLYNATSRRNIVGRRYELSEAGRVRSDDRRGLPVLPLFEMEVTI
jgi:outer membrane receptor protein involved in Fe transport